MRKTITRLRDARGGTSRSPYPLDKDGAPSTAALAGKAQFRPSWRRAAVGLGEAKDTGCEGRGAGDTGGVFRDCQPVTIRRKGQISSAVLS